MIITVLISEQIESLSVRKIVSDLFFYPLFLGIIIFGFWSAYKVYINHDSKNKETITAYNEQYICLRCGNVFRLPQP